MNRLLRKKNLFPVLASLAAVSLAACGGGGSHSSTLPQAAPLATAAPAPYTGPLADTMFTITIPLPKTGSAATRSPKYVSASTTQLRFTLISATAPGLSTAPQISSFNTTNLGVKAITLGSAQCPGAGPWTCTLPLRLPPGTDNMKISAENASSAVYAQQQQNFTVSVGIQNNLTTVLDANVATMALNVTSGFCAGTFTVVNSGTVATVGTQTVSVAAAYKDGAGNTIPTNAPGRPVLKVNGHTDDNGGVGYSDPGNLNVKVTQSTQSFVLQKTDGTGSAAVAVTIAPPNTNSSPSDGLVFTTTPGTTNFTFQSGPAPPASFLANAQQIINGSGVVTGGQINFYTLTLGGSDSFSAFSPATLSNQSNDVDFPNDLLFDTNSDLMIANGGAGNPDFGNFACVPAGSITTGANNATVLTSGLSDPASLALGTDSSVALLNKGNTPTDLMAEFVLNGTYSPAPVSRDVLQSAYPSDGAHESVVALPTTGANPAGSYAMVFTDHTQAGTHIIIKHPDGSVAEFPQDASDVFPYITYDPSNNQIVAANHNGTSSHITFWSVASMTKVNDIIIENNAGNSQGQAAGPIASSADGHIAVIISGASGFPELVVYDNTAGRAKVGGVIDYGATTAAFGATFVYGGTVSANSANKLLWLSNTKLLVNLYSQHTHVATGANGMYIYDITQTMAQTGFDGNGNAEPTPVIKQTAFQSLTNAPLSAAYKP